MISAILVAFLCIINFSVGAQSNGPILDGRGPLKHGLSKRQTFSEFGGRFDRSEFTNTCSIPVTGAQYRFRIIDPCPIFTPSHSETSKSQKIFKGQCSRDYIKNTCKEPYFLIEFNLAPYGINDVDLTLAMAQNDYPSDSYNLLATYGLKGMSGITINNGQQNELIVEGDFPFSNSNPPRPFGGSKYTTNTTFFFAYTKNGVTIGYNDAIIAQSNNLTAIDPVFEGGNIAMRFARLSGNEYEIDNFQITCLDSEEPCGISTISGTVTSISTETETATTIEKATETSTSKVLVTNTVTSSTTEISTTAISSELTIINTVIETKISVESITRTVTETKLSVESIPMTVTSTVLV